MKRRILYMIAATLLVACEERKPVDKQEPEAISLEEYYDSEKYVEVTRVFRSLEVDNTYSPQTSKWVYSYDSQGLLVRLDGYGTTIYEYAEKYRKESLYFDYDGARTLYQVKEYKFLDAEGKMCAEEKETFPEKPSWDIRYERDWNNGRLMEDRTYEKTTTGLEYLSTRNTYTYVDNGLETNKTTESTKYRYDGTAYSNGSSSTLITYRDEKRKKILRTVSGNNVFNRAEHTYKYNDDNLLVAEDYFSQGKLLTFTRFSYSGNTKTKYIAIVDSSDGSRVSQESTIVYTYKEKAPEYEFLSDNSTDKFIQ